MCRLTSLIFFYLERNLEITVNYFFHLSLSLPSSFNKGLSSFQLHYYVLAASLVLGRRLNSKRGIEVAASFDKNNK